MRSSLVPIVLLLVAASACTESPREPATPAGSAATAGSTKEPRYLALGDSFTAGTGATPEQSFPSRLVQRWAAAPGGCTATLLNLGVNGYTSDDLIDDELPKLAPFAPRVVTLAIGANDIVQSATPAGYQRRVHRILAAVVAAGVKRIVAIPQPDWSQSPASRSFGSPAGLHARIVELNDILKAETEAVGGTYVDLFPLMEQEARAQMIANDGLHPSAVAYDAWAEVLSKQVPPPCGGP